MKRFLWLAAVVATATLAFGASSASSGAASPTATQASGVLAQGATAGTVSVRYRINRFVRHGKRLIARGTAIATYTSPTGERTVVRQAFKSRVAMRASHFSAQKICPVLDLTLGPLDLDLLGLLVHLDKVHLTITADSEGGLLGRLLCGLADSGKLKANVVKLNSVAQRSGLSTRGVGFAVPLGSGSGTASTFGTARATVICPILNLTLGPLDLNLLGLMVHLDTVHLVITADSDKGLLGSLLAGLLCPPSG
jgi:hypothetical protein